jgi:hypothetical protein
MDFDIAPINGFVPRHLDYPSRIIDASVASQISKGIR